MVRSFTDSIAVCLVGLCLLAASGCGLAEYESKMQEQQQRIDRLDEETRLLAKPIERQQAKVDGRDAADVYLRPPLGTSITKEAQDWDKQLYWFKGGTQLAVDVYLGWGQKDQDIRGELLKKLSVAQPTVKNMTTKRPDGSAGIELEYIAIEGANMLNYHIYFEPSNKVVIMYVITRQNPAKDANDAREASINTLLIGAEAARARKAFDELQKRMPKRM